MAKRPDWKAELKKNIEKKTTASEVDPIIIERKQTIPITEIKIRSNVREDYSGLESLARSILNQGLLQPIRITKDNYLIAGHRRLKAFEYGLQNFAQFPTEIPFVADQRNSSEISDIDWERLQITENEERQELDNFDLAHFYQRKIDEGYKQKDLIEIFEKSKTTISQILKINNIHPTLKTYCKEFQEFGWSKKKFDASNSFGFTDTDQTFLDNNRTTLGITPLYKIAKHPSLAEQTKEFLKQFRKRLLPEELQSDFFKKFDASNFSDSKRNIAILTLKKVEEKLNNGLKDLKKMIQNEDFEEKDVRILEIKFNDAMETLATLREKQESRKIATSSQKVQTDKTSLKDKQTSTTTATHFIRKDLVVNYENKKIDFTTFTEHYSYGLILSSILDTIIYNRVRKQPINSLKALVKRSLESGMAKNNILDEFLTDDIKPDLIQYIEQGCPREVDFLSDESYNFILNLIKTKKDKLGE